jgi:broad specificity phosphatase PhoE
VIFITHFQRTRQTAEPLAVDLNITPIVIDAVDAVVEAIRNVPAPSVALVVGHSNTVPEIIAQLGGPSLPTLHTTAFDHLFVLAGQQLIHLRYDA